MKDKDIIKALECCGVKRNCRNCLLYEERLTDCIYTVLKNALYLITRQQAEIENLKVENQSLRGAANSLKMHYEEAQAEIERLKKTEIEIDDFCRRLCRMRMLNGNAIASYEDLQNYIQEEKSEAVKEVFEKLNKKAEVGKIIDKNFPFIIRVVTLHDINELKKEMVGDDNA